MQGSSSGPLSAQSILSQQGSGDVTGVPGYTDYIPSPYLQPNSDSKEPSSANGVMAGKRTTEDMATARRDRYQNRVYRPQDGGEDSE
jgi:hypothetical protein